MTDTSTFNRIPEQLKEYATDRQAEFIDAVNQYGGIRPAEAALGLSNDVIGRSLRSLKARAARAGYAPEHNYTHTVPMGFKVKGVSQYIDREGNVAGQWVKSSEDREFAEQAIREWIEAIASGIESRSPIIEPPATTIDDYLAVYPMGDPHFGLVAIAEEVGEDFNLEIAERDLNAAFDRLIAAAPPAKTALIAELGDFFHSDNEQNRTRRSGNPLDAHRWSQVMQVGLRTMVSCIEKVAAKHENVIVRIVKGNHDEHSSFALSLALDAHFRNNPRVTIIVKNTAHWYYEFGKNLIGLTHGDTTKIVDLPGLMAAEMSEAWGRTIYRYWYHGHFHSKRVHEGYGAIVEGFRSLAGKDAWHTAEGYRSGQDMHMLLLHKEYGEVMRTRADIRLVRS